LNRNDFQQLADVRIAEAAALLSQGMHDGAYYLAGYAVECALKACVAKLTNQYDFPDKQLANRCFTHSIEELVKVAGLEAQRNTDVAADADLKTNWTTVKDWSEASRSARMTLAEAQGLYDAITETTHGVLPWLKQRW
jgi:HEPN domain-containing protein